MMQTGKQRNLNRKIQIINRSLAVATSQHHNTTGAGRRAALLQRKGRHSAQNDSTKLLVFKFGERPVRTLNCVGLEQDECQLAHFQFDLINVTNQLYKGGWN